MLFLEFWSSRSLGSILKARGQKFGMISVKEGFLVAQRQLYHCFSQNDFFTSARQLSKKYVSQKSSKHNIFYTFALNPLD